MRGQISLELILALIVVLVTISVFTGFNDIIGQSQNNLSLQNQGKLAVIRLRSELAQLAVYSDQTTLRVTLTTEIPKNQFPKPADSCSIIIDQPNQKITFIFENKAVTPCNINDPKQCTRIKIEKPAVISAGYTIPNSINCGENIVIDKV